MQNLYILLLLFCIIHLQLLLNKIRILVINVILLLFAYLFVLLNVYGLSLLYYWLFVTLLLITICVWMNLRNIWRFWREHFDWNIFSTGCSDLTGCKGNGWILSKRISSHRCHIFEIWFFFLDYISSIEGLLCLCFNNWFLLSLSSFLLFLSFFLV